MKQEDSYWDNSSFLNDLINQLPAAIFWKNEASVFLGCNQCFADLAGLSSPKDIIGKSDYELPWGKTESDQYIQADQDVMRSKLPKLGVEELQTLSNGQVITLLTNKIPVFSKQNKVIGVLGIYHDITARKHIEEELRISKEAAEAANSAKTEFISNMSHDIRTPLSGVVGMSQMIEDNAVDPKQKQYAHWLHDSGDQLLNMLNGILDVVSADNVNEKDLHQESFDFRRMIQNLISVERPTAVVKGLDLVATVDENIPPLLVSDHTKIHRIILNLLGNAVKFTQQGQVEIGVSLLQQESKRVLLQFRVTDTGIGIPYDLQDKVFDRFFRVSPSYKGIYTGHGVGLHIAQSYAHLLGGSILLKSEPGVGTTFHFELWLTVSDEASLPVIEMEQPATVVSDVVIPVSNTLAVDAPKLLLIEDNIVALNMLEYLVAQAGFQFISAVDGAEALEIAKTDAFDLIITDLGLPGLSGLDITREIRLFEQKTQKKPVLIVGLTAHADAKIKQGCIDAGMDEALTKPMSADKLEHIKTRFFPSQGKSVVVQNDAPVEQSSSALGTDLPDTEAELFALAAFPLLNAKSALKEMKNNTALFNRMLTAIVDTELPKDLGEISDAHSRGDWLQVENIAHRMKGGFVYCGISRLAYACQYLERYCKAGHTILLEPLYEQLISVANETTVTLKRWLSVQK